MISRDLLAFVETLAEATDQSADEIMEEVSVGLSLPERRQVLEHYDDLCSYIERLRFDPTANFAVIAADVGLPSYDAVLRERYGEDHECWQ